MAVKIRLQRHGRKGYAYYHIVVADSRSPRDGKFIERLGSYNPNTDPAAVTLNFDRALYWVQVGAQPSDTVRNILSNEGVMLKKHLLVGVKKGAFDDEEVEKRFEAWKNDKESKVSKTKSQLAAEKDAKIKARLAAEEKVKKEKANALTKKKADAVAKAAGEKVKETAKTAAEVPEVVEEVKATTEAVPEVVEEVKEAPEAVQEVVEDVKETADTAAEVADEVKPASEPEETSSEEKEKE